MSCRQNRSFPRSRVTAPLPPRSKTTVSAYDKAVAQHLQGRQPQPKPGLYNMSYYPLFGQPLGTCGNWSVPYQGKCVDLSAYKDEILNDNTGINSTTKGGPLFTRTLGGMVLPTNQSPTTEGSAYAAINGTNMLVGTPYWNEPYTHCIRCTHPVDYDYGL